MSNFLEVLQQFFHTLLIPATFGGLGFVFAIVCKYAKKFVNKMDVRHELGILAKENEIRASILKEVETIVESAVGSKMSIADEMKRLNGDGHLTDAQSAEINKKVKDFILASLPESLTKDDGTLLKYIGGKDRLNIIIDDMIEKYVYEYKIKKMNK